MVSQLSSTMSPLVIKMFGIITYISFLVIKEMIIILKAEICFGLHLKKNNLI